MTSIPFTDESNRLRKVHEMANAPSSMEWARSDVCHSPRTNVDANDHSTSLQIPRLKSVPQVACKIKLSLNFPGENTVGAMRTSPGGPPCAV